MRGFPLQERTGRYLEQLCAGMTLALSATRPVNTRGRSAGAAAEIDKISKTVTVRPSLGAFGEVSPSHFKISGGLGILELKGFSHEGSSYHPRTLYDYQTDHVAADQFYLLPGKIV